MSWSRFFHRRRWDRERSRELDAYLEVEFADNIDRGMSPEDALVAARRKLGNRTRIREEIYQMNTLQFVETLWQDLRHGARLLRLNPGFAVVAIASLALGIGANTAIFQLINAVRLRALPVRSPQELVEVRIADMKNARGNINSPYDPVTKAVWERIRDDVHIFSGTFAWGADTFNIAASGEARFARGIWVSGGFFNVLGVPPVLGRVFGAADDGRGCGSPSVVLSYSFWQSEFGGNKSILGQKMLLEGRPFEIVGVTPASFTGLEIGKSFGFAVPLSAEGFCQPPDGSTTWWLTVMGRLKPGSSIAQASAQLSAASPGIFEATLPKGYPAANVKDYLGYRLAAYPAASGVSQLREQYSTPLWLLLAIAALVLAIACANLANLMLARASARAREIAVRLAMGASRRRLIRQLLAESLLLAGLGAIAGALVARNLSAFLVAFLSREGDQLFVDLAPDWRVLGFTAALAIVTCMLFGLTPALRASRAEPGSAIKTGSRGLTASRERLGLRRMLVVSQVAASLVLLVSALLFVRSLRNLMTLDAGFKQDGVLIVSTDLSRLDLPLPRRQAAKQDLMERLRAIPGVAAAAEVGFVPIEGSGGSNQVWKDGTESTQGMVSNFNFIGSDYFKTLRIPLLTGRDFDRRDALGSPNVAIVNEAFARQLGLGANPLGQRFRREATQQDREAVYQIVGLVKNTKYRSLRAEFKPIAYLAKNQHAHPGGGDDIVVRSSMPLLALTSGVKSAINEFNPRVAFSFQAFEELVQGSLLPERLMATLSGFFGILAALIATVGLYGVMSYLVAQRRNEIGIRIALGAGPRGIVSLILGEAGILLAAGLVIGTILAAGTATFARSMLFGLGPYDATTFLLAIAALTAVALSASYFPARRAAALDPMDALRE